VVRLGAYVVGLLVVFGGAMGLGSLVGPVAGTAAPHAASQALHGGHAPLGDPPAADVPGGLQTAQDGYRLVPVTTALTAGGVTDFAFRVLGPDRAPVTRYTPTHERSLHLVVVRRDLSGFQHVHPALGADGVWRIPLTVPASGQYRVFADFQPAGRSRPLALGVDVPAVGDYRPIPLPAPARTATVDGYTVNLAGDLVAGGASTVALRVSRDGKPVTDLQPYLGAYGHLVALRDGDLAYLHVHPDGAAGDGRTAPGPEITFHAEVPSAGTYRLYLDFRHAGRVHTAEFTATAADTPGGTGTGGAVTDPHSHDQHD
jgi:hypothetical protein